MTPDEACLRLHAFWMDYLESRRYFLGAGKAVDPEDEAAMIIGSVVYEAGHQKTCVLFMCSTEIDPEGPAVRGWMDECVAAARRDEADTLAVLGELSVGCAREFRGGLTQ